MCCVSVNTLNMILMTLLYMVRGSTMLTYNLSKGKSLNEFINKGNNDKIIICLFIMLYTQD